MVLVSSSIGNHGQRRRPFISPDKPSHPSPFADTSRPWRGSTARHCNPPSSVGETWYRQAAVNRIPPKGPGLGVQIEVYVPERSSYPPVRRHLRQLTETRGRTLAQPWEWRNAGVGQGATHHTIPGRVYGVWSAPPAYRRRRSHDRQTGGNDHTETPTIGLVPWPCYVDGARPVSGSEAHKYEAARPRVHQRVPTWLSRYQPPLLRCSLSTIPRPRLRAYATRRTYPPIIRVPDHGFPPRPRCHRFAYCCARCNSG